MLLWGCCVLFLPDLKAQDRDSTLQANPQKNPILIQEGNIQRGKTPAADSTARTPQDTTAVSDSSKVIRRDSVEYGFGTTNFIRERQLYFFGDSGQVLDTLVGFMHRYNQIQRHENRYQNLGNIGTPLSPIFYQTPTQIGTRWGQENYRFFIPEPDDIRYFNTQSPFTNLYLVQGGQGKTDLVVEFARNINPEWNVELFYNRKSANRVIADNFQRNDVMLTHQVFGGATRFYSPRRRYKLLAHFFYYQLDNIEQGGLEAPRITNDIDSLLSAPNADLSERLSSVSHRQDGRRAHIYHEYALAADRLALFHRFTWQNDVSRYKDESYLANAAFYARDYFDSLQVQQSRFVSSFGLVENVAGFKTRLSQVQLRGYAKYRNYSFRTAFIRPQDSVTRDSTASRNLASELFVGGTLRMEIPNLGRLNAEAEYLIAGGYRFAGLWESRLLSLRATRTNYAPDIWARDRRFGNHYRWDNREAKNITANEFEATYTYTHRHAADSVWSFQVRPFARYRTYENFVYYDSASLAVQDTSSFEIAHVGFRASGHYNYWRMRTEVMYSRNLGRSIIRMPRVFVNLSIYYERNLFGGIMPSQIGLDLHWKSKFLANAFNPAIQQFHLQNDHRVGNYIYADAFWNFRVNRVFLFLKINNLLQGVSAPNYFETPFYIAQPRSFEFGFQWRFFD